MTMPDKNNLPEGVCYDEEGDCIITEGLCCTWGFYITLLNHPMLQEKYDDLHN